MRKKCGLKKDSVFGDLCADSQFFKLSPPDIFHDISEGILPVFLSWFLQESGVEMSDWNAQINKMAWVNGPVRISKEKKVLGNASQVTSNF